MTSYSDSPARLCPHCSSPMVDPPVTDRCQGATRCSTCRLLVGAGRSVPSDEPTTTGAGAAIGWIAAKARREENVDAASPDTVRAAIRTVAKSLEDPVDRLRMVDYQRQAAERPSLPALADVYSAFGTWKKARLAAAGQPDG